MHFVVRKDLGGFAAAAPALERLASVEITKPFVLLCGPNGSGKTALLRMMRNAMGVSGERAGRSRPGEFIRPASVEQCAGDLGKLAAFTSGFGNIGIDRDVAGVLDVAALGWHGQRSWLFDSRKENELLKASSFDQDFGYHVAMLTSGGGRRSHGEFLRSGWTMALRFAIGSLSSEGDPFSEIEHLPPARQALWNACVPDGMRSTERWLLLDEPETALDIEALMIGICLLAQIAAAGRLRVFCASHSPMFAAGLADHANVQIVDLAPDQGWLGRHRRALEVARDPGAILSVAGRALEALDNIARMESEAAAAESRKQIAVALKGLRHDPRKFLLAALDQPDHALPSELPGGKKLTDTLVWNLDDRKLVRRTGSPKSPAARLTALGVQAARHIASKQLNQAPHA